MATRDIGQLRTRLSFEDEGSARSLEGLRRDLRGLRSEMNVARSKGREYTQSLKGMREQSDILSRRLKTQQERVRELRKRYDESVRVKGEDATQTKNLAAQYNNAVAEMNRTENQLKNLNYEIKRMESPWTQLGERLDATGTKLQTLGHGMTDFGRSYSMRVTAPIVAGGTAVFKAAMDYETAFAGVRKTVDATEEQFASLSAGIRAMAKELPQSANEIANVAEVAGQLGIKQEDILKFTRTMVDLGVATNMSSEEAATSLARLANITQMPMDQIDRLGATVVDLGNNLATTEREIVEMGLRLAGAGKQVGMSEAQILAFSGALSSVGIAAEAGGSAFSKVMVNMQLATERGGKELQAFAKVAGMSSKEFKQAFERDAAGAIITFINGLSKVAKDGDTAIGVLDEMGITEVRMRDALLRAAGASDVFTNSIALGTKAWDENTALTKEAEERYKTTESQLKIMWNRIKDVSISLGNGLAPAVMDAIKAADPFIKQIENGAKAFSEMDEQQQRTILKMVAFVAAVGPASVVMGNLTTAIGGAMRVGGNFAKMLGKAGATGGTGLLGRLALMSPAAITPVGLAIAGVGALGYAIYRSSKNTQDFNRVSLETAESMTKQADELKKSIDAFDKLQEKNRLTNDELARFVDINSELAKTSNEETIKRLREEQERLLEKSGLTNDEMNQFLQLNEEIAKQVPETNKQITNQGNVLIENSEAAKKVNAEQRERIRLEYEAQMATAEANRTQLLREEQALIKEINKLIKERESNVKEIQEATARVNELEHEYKNLSATTNYETKIALYEKLDAERKNLQALIEQDEKQSSLLDKKSEELASTREQMKQMDQVSQKYIEFELAQVGINAEKGKEIELIDKEIDKLNKAKSELDEKRKKQEINNREYQTSVDKIDNLISSLYDARYNVTKIREEQQRTNNTIGLGVDEAWKLTNELSKDVRKEVSVDDKGTAAKVQKEAEKPATKRVTLRAAWEGVKRGLSLFVPGFADGTDYHKGGPFVAGEEGFELGRLGNRWEMLNFGLYDRPAGYQVFTHDESKKILRALNSMPAYANGTNMGAETNRVVQQLNEQQSVSLKGEAVVYTTIINQIDSRELSRHTYRHVTELQEQDRRVRESFA